MNDFEYDVLQKKRLARNSQKKKNGSRSRKCTLPSDFLTKKQIEGMAKELYSVNLGKPMKWVEFKSLPLDIQKEYLQTLIDRYNCSYDQLAKMFGLSNGTAVYRHLQRNGVSVQFINKGRRSREQHQNWLCFLALNDAPTSLKDCQIVKESKLSRFELSWEGDVSLEAVMKKVSGLAGGSKLCKVSISVELGGG